VEPQCPSPRPISSFLHKSSQKSIPGSKHCNRENDEEDDEEKQARIGMHHLKNLFHSSEVCDALKSQEIRKLVLKIDSEEQDKQREALLVQAMKIPSFERFVDDCLKVVRNTK
jgi:hypothetical protein